MKKLIWYALLLGASFLAPLQGTDVGELLPVELIQIYKEGGSVVIATDAGAAGTGTTVEEAVADMREAAVGIVFLDTADNLLIKDLSNEEVAHLKEYLKPGIRICHQQGEIKPEDASVFLRVHKPSCRLKDWEEGKMAEILVEENGSLHLKEI